MLTGSVSSDDEGDDFYSDPLIRKNKNINFLAIQTKEIREELHSALDLREKSNLFLRAVEESDLNALERLIALGVNVDSSGPSEWTPLMRACSLGNHEVVEFLLEKGANPNLHKELFTPLMACCTDTYIPEDGKLNNVRLLLQYNVDVNAKDKYRTTALMYASGSGYKNIVDILLSVSDINVNLQDKEGSTALFYAVGNNHSEIVQKLVGAGSCLNLKDRFGRTALNVALQKQLMDVATTLGYTETNLLIKDEKITKNSFSEILNDLPIPSGDGGFYSDVEPILQYLVQFRPNCKVSLPEFLNYTDTDLHEIGVLFKPDRLKILKHTIHEYHLSPWKKSSMPPISSDTVKIDDAIGITSSLMKHLTIANASLKYLKTRIASRQNCNVPDLSTEKELITVLLNTYSIAGCLKNLLQEIHKHSNQLKICTPDDFIAHDLKSTKYPKGMHLKQLGYAVGAAVGAYLIFCVKSQNKAFNLC